MAKKILLLGNKAIVWYRNSCIYHPVNLEILFTTLSFDWRVIGIVVDDEYDSIFNLLTNFFWSVYNTFWIL